MLVLFMQKEDKRLRSAVFSTKKGLISTTPECNKRSTVFSRLPILMATDKPCPQLQPSLGPRAKFLRLTNST